MSEKKDSKHRFSSLFKSSSRSKADEENAKGPPTKVSGGTKDLSKVSDANNHSAKVSDGSNDSTKVSDDNRDTSIISDDSQLTFLIEYDTVFLIDDSRSMDRPADSHQRSSWEYVSRWEEVSRVLADIAPLCTKYDQDGIDIHFLNHPDETRKNVTTAKEVTAIFNSYRPNGGTPTGHRLWQILGPYVDRYKMAVDEANGVDGQGSEPESPTKLSPYVDHYQTTIDEANGQRREPELPKKLNLIVITDGEAHDDVATPIVENAKRLKKMGADQWQVGIQFCQVGDDVDASEALRKLDDELESRTEGWDIVDTARYTDGSSEKLTSKILLGAINKRIDRQKLG